LQTLQRYGEVSIQVKNSSARPPRRKQVNKQKQTVSKKDQNNTLIFYAFCQRKIIPCTFLGSLWIFVQNCEVYRSTLGMYLHFCENANVAPAEAQGPWFEQTSFCSMSEESQANLSFLGPVVLE
jgi:hypothetical protein